MCVKYEDSFVFCSPIKKKTLISKITPHNNGILIPHHPNGTTVDLQHSTTAIAARTYEPPPPRDRSARSPPPPHSFSASSRTIAAAISPLSLSANASKVSGVILFCSSKLKRRSRIRSAVVRGCLRNKRK